MSRKWQRTKQWDAQHLTGPLAPVRLVLGALSSIRLAVLLLSLIAVYGALASVPIGLLILTPTWAVIAASAALAVVSGAVVTGWPASRLTARAGRLVRFGGTLVLGLAGAVAAAWAWARFAWPALHYDPATGAGLRFFADAAEQYASITLRRLPGFEMTELEFYSWWPMRAILLAFVLNLFVATVRRIEFTFKNLGVLTVHTGIIIIALGSVYYQSLKKEGETILLAGQPGGEGLASLGPAQRAFYDHTRVVLYVSQEGRRGALGERSLEQRPIRGLPRYNDYGLDLPEADAGRTLSIDVPAWGPSLVDPDIRLRVVGYAAYAEMAEEVVRLDTLEGVDLAPDEALDPLVSFELFFTPRGEDRADHDRPAFRFDLHPRSPARRISENEAVGFEVTAGMPAARWADLTAAAPAAARHVITVEIPGATRPDGTPATFVLPATRGDVYRIADTGWTVAVKSIEPQPPFPIITKGYEGATSAVAILRITQPDGVSYDRWVYHRFPEISQDLLDPDPANPARPSRRDADTSIRVGFLDLSRLQIYVDERADGTVRAVVRGPGSPPKVYDNVALGEKLLDVIERIDIRLANRWPHTRRVIRPTPVPAAERDRRFDGTHEQARVGVEVSIAGNDTWSRKVWLPFMRYMGVAGEEPEPITLPDGRVIRVAFGRLQHPFPGFSLRLADFEMLSYDHRGAPRDYQSTVMVDLPAHTGADRTEFTPFQRVVKLNSPLRAPFTWSDERSLPANLGMYLSRGLNPRQYKISQSGWDQAGWTESQALADAGTIPKPFARFTIMHVGNNPGIHVIAFGGILMAIGTPWAFYIKPWLVRREKRRLAAAHARPADHTPAAPQEVPVT